MQLRFGVQGVVVIGCRWVGEGVGEGKRVRKKTLGQGKEKVIKLWMMMQGSTAR